MWFVCDWSEVVISLTFTDVLCRPHGNHKAKAHSGQDGNQSMPPQKIISAQRKTAREEKKNKGTTKNPEDD